MARQSGSLRGRAFDSEGSELRALHQAACFEAARVLEIGAGDGRLSFRYAEEAAQVIGVDLAADVVHKASRSRPLELAGRLRFHRADARYLPFRGGTFDIALLGWSL